MLKYFKNLAYQLNAIREKQVLISRQNNIIIENLELQNQHLKKLSSTVTENNNGHGANTYLVTGHWNKSS